jgi:hypothetical protein
VRNLFDFDFGASVDEGLLVAFGFDWADVLFDSGWSAIDEFLGIHKAKTGDGLDSLDDGNLGTSAKAFEEEADFSWASVDWAFFFGWGSGSGDSGGNAEFSFDRFDELVELEDGHLL